MGDRGPRSQGGTYGEILRKIGGEVVSSEGALYVILPYDYPAQRSGHFLNTHRSLITTLSIDAMMTLLTMMTKITEIT